MSGTVSETIAYSLKDADGDTSSGTLTLNVSREGSTVTGTGGVDTLSGTTGSDVLIGGAGNDTLSGLVGGDTFTWQLADRGTSVSPALDTVTDFDLAINSDKLDLRDLLQGESHTGTNVGNLADYLHFSYDASTSTTVLEVKSQGAGMTGPDQIINLSGVDLVTGYTSDQQIIQDLLSKGKLITD
jgi:Ca2+-binding RTX toxin-like protein